jgi:cardiolipin synthase
VIQSSPGLGATAAGTVHLLAIQCARRTVAIANSYFIPDPRIIDMLARACRRGVKVTLMLAGRLNDTWWARQNSVRLYGQLLEAGVEIHEYTPAMLHQKVMIVDEAWATVGTTNFDNRSFALNDETNVCFTDRALVRELQDTFARDLTRCRHITMDAWRRRGIVQRTTELFASVIEDQL